MSELKIIIPMAGIGKRLVPLTSHKPKALVRLAHQRLLDHVLNTFHELEKRYRLEYIFIIGYLGEQIKNYMQDAHPDKKVKYYVQKQLMGQSHAVYAAKDSISGPILLTYCDAINEIDFSFLSLENIDGVLAIQEVDDPRSHGVALLGPGNLVTKLIEKPKSMVNKSVLTGLYFFAEGRELIKGIETQIRRGISLNHEYYLADAINILLEQELRITTQRVFRWLDAGTPEALIETNAYLLQQRAESHDQIPGRQSNILIDPVYIHETSHVENCIIGPNVAIGSNCSISRCILKNTIIDDDSDLTEVVLMNSLIGEGCSVNGKPMQSIVADHDKA